MKSNNFKNLTAGLLTSLAILLIFAVGASAQTGGTISGIVSNLKTPRANVKVLLRSATNEVMATTETDAKGKYSFTGVAAGKYIVAAELGEMAGTITSEVIVKNNQSLTVDLTYGPQTPSTINFGEVVIIASGTTQPVDTVSKSVSVVDAAELRDRNEITIVDSLRTVPGLRVQQTGGFGRLASIKTRGLRNQDTAVLIDGQRFRDAAAINGDASPFLSDLQVTNVSRVEILRGSGSSLYGTNAIGGVFDIRTGDLTSDFSGSLLGEGGGLGLARGRASVSDSFFSGKFGFSAGLAHTNFSNGVDGDDAARNTSGQGRADFLISDTAGLSVRFYAADAFVQLNSNPDTAGTLPATGIIEARAVPRDVLRRLERGETIALPSGANFIPDFNDPDASQSSHFVNGRVAFLQVFNNIFYEVSYQNLDTSRENPNGSAGRSFQPFGATTRGRFDGNIQTVRGRADLRLGRSNLVTAGYEFEREKYGNDNFRNDVSTDATDAAQRSHTVFAQNQFQAYDRRLRISGAARAQFFDLENPTFSAASPYRDARLDNPATAYTFDGSAAFLFRSTGTKLRGHVGNGYRVPSLYERFGTFFNTFGTPGFVPLGAPDLEPERSIAVDAGVDQTLASKRVRLSATYFYTRLTDTIGFSNSLTNDSFGRFFGYFNTKGGIARGGEFSAEINPFDKTNVFTSYTFTKSLQREAQVSGSGILQTLGVPEHQFSLVFTQRIVDRLTVNFDFAATSSYLAPIFSNTTFATRLYRFEGNRKGDVTAAYEIPTGGDKLRFRLFGTIENIFNQDYYENGFRTARATARGGLQLNF